MLRSLAAIFLSAILFSACAECDIPFPYQPNLPTDFNLNQESGEVGMMLGSVAAFSYELFSDQDDGLLLQRLGCFDTLGHIGDYYYRDRSNTMRYHFEYDSIGRRTEEFYYIDSAGKSYDSLTVPFTHTTFRYSRQGRRCKAQIEGPDGRKDTFRLHFNRQGQLTKYIFPDGSRFSYEYDADGRLAKRINPDASVEEYAVQKRPLPLTLDSLGRVLEEKVSDTDGLVMAYYVYDDHGNWVRRTTTGERLPSKLEVRTFAYYN